jgi:hypothetical protein
MTEDSKAVMAGLVPAIHDSDEPLAKVVPGGVRCQYEAHLPLSRPVLDVVFALNRGPDVRVRLCVYQLLQAVALGEAFDEAFAMFLGATREVCVQRAVRSVGHYVHPRALHRESVGPHSTSRNVSWMAGTSPAMTVAGGH